MITIALLLVSNIFMTLAWYGHLKFPHLPMVAAILIGWGIALVEYAVAGPANRIGFRHWFHSGPGQPHRLRPRLHRRSAQDHAGGGDAGRVRAVRGDRPQGTRRLALFRRLRVPCGSGSFHVCRANLKAGRKAMKPDRLNAFT